MTIEQIHRYLMADGNLRVPCSRYGFDTESCVPVASATARAYADAAGEELSTETLDLAMSLIVNDSDDPADLILSHGTDADVRTLCECEGLEQDWIRCAADLGTQAAIPAIAYKRERPNLSGEWADAETPASLIDHCAGVPGAFRRVPDWIADAICDAYESAVAYEYETADD